MTTPDQDAVSREAHSRVTKERDELKALLEKANSELTDIHLTRQAETWFKGMEATNPEAWAANALPHLRGLETDKIQETLEQRFAPLITPAPAPTPPDDTDEVPQEAAPPPVVPRPGIAGPDPAAPAAPAATPKITWDEVKKRIEQSGSWEPYRQALLDGSYTPDPSNEHAQEILRNK